MTNFLQSIDKFLKMDRGRGKKSNVYTKPSGQSARRLFWGPICALLILAMLLPAAPSTAYAQTCEGDDCAADVSETSDVARFTTYAMISSVRSEADGQQIVEIEWATAYETFNAGFNIVVETDDGFVAVNDELIPSDVIDSLEPQFYSTTATLAGDEFYLEHVTVEGESHRTGPFTVGESVGEVVEPEEVDWASIRAESEALAEEREAERIVEINAALDVVRGPAPSPDEEPVEQSAGVLGGSSSLYLPMIGARGDDLEAAGVDAIDVVDGVTVNLLVQEEGVYRVYFNDIDKDGTGVDLEGVPSAYLALTNKGKPVRIRMVSTQNWGDNSYFEFIGEGIETLYTKDNIYVLQVDRSKAFRTFRNLRAPDPEEDAPEYYTESAAIERNDLYGWVQTAPTEIDPFPWTPFNRTGITAVSKNFDFDGITAIAPGQPAEIFLEVWGKGNVTHKLEVELNGVSIATDIEYFGLVVHTPTLDVPASTLAGGTNQLKLTVPANAAVATDASFFEGFTIHYPRNFVAEDGMLTFSGSENRFEVTDLPSSDVMIYSVYRDRVWRHEAVTTTPSGDAYDISFYGWGQDAQYYMATSNGAVRTPVIQAGQSLARDITSGDVDYIMISHPDFIDALGPLKARREEEYIRDGEKYRVKIVNVLDIYAQFGHGIFGAQPIQDYIKHAINNMGAEYFLLVGDDTIDYFNYTYNYFGPLTSFMPTIYGPVLEWTRGSVDPLFTDVNDDGIPDAKIGRFPVHTAEETTWLVNKTLNYTPNGVASIFTADTGFSTESNQFSATLPANWRVISETAYLDDMSGTAAHTKLKSEVEDGVTLVSYLGHGSMDRWTLGAQLLNVDSAKAIANTDKPALFLQWGCNTSFYGYYTATVSEALLVSEDRGAVATFAATGPTLLSSDAALALRLTPRVVEEGKTLGNAIQEARLNMISEWGYSADVITGLTLLGDPTLIVVPEP